MAADKPLRDRFHRPAAMLVPPLPHFHAARRTFATAALPVALAYLLFQRRVTESIALSAGIKG